MPVGVPRSRRRSGRWRSAARRRSASPRRTASRSRRARRGSRRGLRRARRSRPTAVNLAWALEEMRADPSPSARGAPRRDEVERCRRMAAHAAELLAPGSRVLTHCNAGGLATGATGARSARSARLGARPVAHVWVDETRPLLQGRSADGMGARRARHPFAVIADGRAASLMAAGEVDAVVTGADRIAANGDTANKIGTYGLAVLAHHHGSRSTWSRRPRRSTRRTPTGRDPDRGARPARGVARFPARNPAFDVTPAELIAAIVTEEGVHRAPYAETLAAAGGRMKAIVLAAGYATRLYPLTLDRPKALLDVGGGPMLDRVLDASSRSGDRRGDRRNERAVRADFEDWAVGPERGEVLDDGTTSRGGPAGSDRRHRLRARAARARRRPRRGRRRQPVRLRPRRFGRGGREATPPCWPSTTSATRGRCRSTTQVESTATGACRSSRRSPSRRDDPGGRRALPLSPEHVAAGPGSTSTRATTRISRAGSSSGSTPRSPSTGGRPGDWLDIGSSREARAGRHLLRSGRPARRGPPSSTNTHRRGCLV